MAGFVANQYFSNSGNGKAAFAISKSLDYKKKKLDERREVVDEILDNTDFFVNYFSDNYNPCVSQREGLSEDIAACKTLESMANYLLNSEEVVVQDRAEKEFTYHKSRDKFNNKLKREKVIISTNDGSVNVAEDDEIMNHLARHSKNFKLRKKVQITKKDLEEDSFLGQVLRDYNSLYLKASGKLKEHPDKNWRLYSNAKYTVMQDMIDSKIALRGIWGPSTFLPGSKIKRNYDLFDFTDYKTVRYLLEQKADLEQDSEMWHILTDFNNLVNSCEFTEEENIVLSCLRLGWTIVEIADYTKINYARIKQTVIRNIVKKIIKKGNRYDAEDKRLYYILETRRGNDKPLEGD